MKNAITFFRHRRLQQALVFYIDGELSQNETAQMRRHLENCAECRQKLADIHACRELLKVGRTPQFVPTEQLWQRINRKTSPPERFRLSEIFSAAQWRYLRWSIAVAMLILFGVTVWDKINESDHGILDGARRPVAAAAIDYGIFLDDMRQETSDANFYKRYPAQVVRLAEAQQAIAFPLAAIEALPDSFRLDCVRVLECSGKKCIQFTCIKADKVINIFQHALGQPWTLGQYAVARAPICNVECLLVNAKNLTAVSWQGSESEYLAVGDLTPQEFEQVVQTLQ